MKKLTKEKALQLIEEYEREDRFDPQVTVKRAVANFAEMREHVKLPYLRELYSIWNPDRAVFGLGRHERRNFNVVWLVRNRLVRSHRKGDHAFKAYVVTTLGLQVLTELKLDPHYLFSSSFGAPDDKDE